MGFGEWIKQKRSENDWTQMQLSQITGIPQTTISNWERYKTNPSLKHLPCLAKTFSVDFSEIVSCIDLSKSQRDIK